MSARGDADVLAAALGDGAVVSEALGEV
ncbi:MAG: hypothetical protein QOH00_2397, partial [Gaiellales bacterium]|nr:hypothetical protein [Gaiellales bacterium]